MVFVRIPLLILFSIIFAACCKTAVPATVRAGGGGSNKSGTETILIEGGVFTMGSPDSEQGRGADELQHQVNVSSFYMAKHPVNQKEYQEIMGTNPGHNKKEDLPVDNVSWDEAVEYCNRLSEKEGLVPAYTRSGGPVIWNTEASGYRLPTEAEWEYVRCAGTAGPYPVGEWCWDWYAQYNTATQTDPQGPREGWFDQKVVRGGDWSESEANQRPAARFRSDVSNRMQGLGFRVARSNKK